MEQVSLRDHRIPQEAPRPTGERLKGREACNSFYITDKDEHPNEISKEKEGKIGIRTCWLTYLQPP